MLHFPILISLSLTCHSYCLFIGCFLWSFYATEYRGVFTDIHMSKTLLEEITAEWQHAIKTTNHIYFWKAKRQLNAHGKNNQKRLGKMLISTDLNAQKTTLQITVWWCHLVCIMTSYDKWQRSGSHSIITSWLKQHYWDLGRCLENECQARLQRQHCSMSQHEYLASFVM